MKHSYQDNPKIEVHKSDTQFEVREKKRMFRQKFFFLSDIRNGTVYINASLRNKKRHSNELSGKVLFDHMMMHYTPERVKTIIGHWYDYSDNHKAFIKAMDSGMTPSEAALETWTGKQAAKYGYKYASVTFAKHRSMDPSFDYYMIFFSKEPSDKSDEVDSVLVPYKANSISY
jgi:hypothetical protein